MNKKAKKFLESCQIEDQIIFDKNEATWRLSGLLRTFEEENEPEKLFIHGVTKRNWFEKMPLHWRLLYYFIGGIIIGLLLPYVW